MGGQTIVRQSRRRFFLSSFWTAAASTWIITGHESVSQAKPLPPIGVASSPISDSLYDPSLAGTSLAGEAADRLGIQKLVDGWAHYADRRLPVKQAELFVPDGVVNNYEGEPSHNKPISTLRGRSELIKALAVLNNFAMTFHFNGQTELAISGNRASGETYCIAHQITQHEDERKLQILAIRYYDRFVRTDGRWFFEERNLIIDISDVRPSAVK
jgi:hypothetical protein